MKKPFFKTTVGKIITGAADTFTGGMVSNIVEATETHPSGKLDTIKAIGVIVTGLILVYLVVTGKITVDQANELKELTE